MKKIFFIFSIFFVLCLQSEAQGFALGAGLADSGQKSYNWKGEERECTQLMKELGMNAVRISVSEEKLPEEETLNARKQGLDILIDLNVTKNASTILKKLKQEGISPKWIQLPCDKTSYKAVKAVFPDAKVLVHLDSGCDNAICSRELEALKEKGGKWDMIGLSLYPYKAVQSGIEANVMYAIGDCVKNIRKLAETYGCDVMITELGFETDETNPWKIQQGREQFAEILKKVRTNTNGHCQGVFLEKLPEKPNEIMRALLNEECRAKADNLLPVTYYLLPDYDRKVVKLVTTEGDIYVELYNETPIHRDNFLRLAENCSLDSTLFHRVIKGFMIQGGGPDSKYAPPTTKEKPAELTANEDVPAIDGTNTLKAEMLYPRFFHKRGALAAAREGDDVNPEKKSSSSQFYIVWGKWPAVAGKHPYLPMLDYYKDYNEAGTPWLDGGYTVFGEVLSGLDIVDKIQQSETDSNDRPIKDVRLMKMIILNN